MSSNYEDVLGQLTAEGLQVTSLEIGKLRRCKVEGSTEKRGWYHLHEIRLANGHDLIVGSFGVWRGDSKNTMKVEITKNELNAEQRESIRKRQAEDLRNAEAARKADAERAAMAASAAWKKCTEDGDCEYLHRKGVAGHGVRYSPSGAMAIPMLDGKGNIHGLQWIYAKPKGSLDKLYWPPGVSTRSHFHLIGEPAWVVLICEGYATGASLAMAKIAAEKKKPLSSRSRTFR